MQRTAYRIDKAGSLARLKPVSETLAAPLAHEVCVEVRAIGLNFADIFAIFGVYSATPKGSFVPGLEYAGVVLAVGTAVSTLKPGDRVMGVTRFGGYATHLNTDARYAIPLPDHWTFAEGASYLVQGLTAYYALVPLGALEAGHTVLIHSAAGGVGLLAHRIAKKLGAYTIGSVGHADKLPLLAEEGYDQGLVRGRDFPQRLRECLGDRELNLILECIGGRIFRQGFEALAPMGRVVVYGAAQYASPGVRPDYLKMAWLYLRRPRLDVQNMTNLNKSVLAFNLIHLYEKAEILHRVLAEIDALKLPPPRVGHTFPFSALVDAIRYFQTGKTVGKVVVEVTDM